MTNQAMVDYCKKDVEITRAMTDGKPASKFRCNREDMVRFYGSVASVEELAALNADGLHKFAVAVYDNPEKKKRHEYLTYYFVYSNGAWNPEPTTAIAYAPFYGACGTEPIARQYPYGHPYAAPHVPASDPYYVSAQDWSYWTVDEHVWKYHSLIYPEPGVYLSYLEVGYPPRKAKDVA